MTAYVNSCTIDRTTAELGIVTVKEDKKGGTYKIGYEVMMSEKCGPLTVLEQAQAGSPHALPVLWSSYSYLGDTDSSSFLKTYTVNRDLKVERRYFVTCYFEPAEPGEMYEGDSPVPIAAAANPMDRKPVIWWDREVTTKLVQKDADGNGLLNSAATLYEDHTEVEQAKAILVCEWNVATNAEFIEFSRRYDQAVNSSTWTFQGVDYGPRTAMIREISSSPTIREGPAISLTPQTGTDSYTYRKLSMRIAFADEGETWDVPHAELGQHHFTKTGGVFDMDVVSGFRKRTNAGSVVPLNSDGTRRDDTLSVVFTDKRLRKEKDFNSITVLST